MEPMAPERRPSRNSKHLRSALGAWLRFLSCFCSCIKGELCLDTKKGRNMSNEFLILITHTKRKKLDTTLPWRLRVCHQFFFFFSDVALLFLLRVSSMMSLINPLIWSVVYKNSDVEVQNNDVEHLRELTR